MSNQKKDFVFIQGSAKEAPFATGTGDVINLQINVQQLLDLVAANPEKHKNGYARVTLRRKKEETEYATHFMHEDDYTPDPSKQRKPAPQRKAGKGGAKYIEPSNRADNWDQDPPF